MQWSRRRRTHREELAGEIVARTGELNLAEKLGSGWSAVLKPPAWQGLLCNGISQGNRVMFTSPATWLPAWKGSPEPRGRRRHRDSAYLGAHGRIADNFLAFWLQVLIRYRGRSRGPR